MDGGSTDAWGLGSDVLTLDAAAGDAALGCGSGLTLRQLETDPAAVLAAPRAARVGGGRLVIWSHGPATPPINALSFLADDTLALAALTTPWSPGPTLLVMDDGAGPVVVTNPTDADPEYRWSRFSGSLGGLLPLSLPISAEESVRDLAVCAGRASLALLIDRDDGRSGVATLMWMAGADVASTAPFYPDDDAYGTWRVTGGMDMPPTLQSCSGSPAGDLLIAIGPSSATAPVVTRVPGDGTAPSTMALGADPGAALLAQLSSGEVAAYVLSGSRLAAYAITTGTAVLTASTSLPSVPRGSVLIGVAAVGRRSLLLFTNELGTWAIVSDHDAGTFGPAVSLTDLRCESADVFHVGADGALHLVASCGVGVLGAQLVDLSLCGGA